MHQQWCSTAETSQQTPDSKTRLNSKIFRHLLDDDRLNHHYLDSFGEDTNLVDDHLYVEAPDSSFELCAAIYSVSWQVTLRKISHF